MQLITFTDKGLFVPQAGVYIDPWRPVQKAIITHGHSDHARYGHKAYISTHTALPVIKYRLGSEINISGMNYGETFSINGVSFCFYPAGHIIGSAQVSVTYKGETWVISGDYKTTDDGLSERFEPVKCHTFITESTFGLPVFHWQEEQHVVQKINDWWSTNADEGKPSIISAYALGKAQRIIHQVDQSIGPIYTHGAVENINEVIRNQGITLPKTIRVDSSIKNQDYSRGLIVAPPAAIDSKWSKRFSHSRTASASGWMMMRGTRRRRAVDKGFVLSDHADWNGLLNAIKETTAERIYVTHGYTNIFSRYLSELGYDAGVVQTEFSSEEDQPNLES